LCRLKIVALSGLLLVAAGCAKADLHKTLKTNRFQPGDRSPMMLAAYQPWFGNRSHINVGYSSQDRVVLQRQIEQAKELGIAGFVVNWYGPEKQFENRSYATLQELASQSAFNVALMYDEDDSDPSSTTERTLSDLRYAYEHYIAPNAEVPSQSYLKYNGRPVIFIFPKNGKTDWDKVRRTVNEWPDQPLLIYKDVNNTKYPNDFDGFYAWVHPGKSGWQKAGNDWGQDYLDNFYNTMNSKYPDKIAVGAAWPGFDDSKASWSRNRRMDARCGKTFEDSLRLFRRYYDAAHPLPFLMIVTWNDYEEGTAIERGYTRCGNDRSVGIPNSNVPSGAQ
jgi:hypothetical protein